MKHCAFDCLPSCKIFKFQTTLRAADRGGGSPKSHAAFALVFRNMFGWRRFSNPFYAEPGQNIKQVHVYGAWGWGYVTKAVCVGIFVDLTAQPFLRELQRVCHLHRACADVCFDNASNFVESSNFKDLLFFNTTSPIRGKNRDEIAFCSIPFRHTLTIYGETQ